MFSSLLRKATVLAETSETIRIFSQYELFISSFITFLICQATHRIFLNLMMFEPFFSTLAWSKLGYIFLPGLELFFVVVVVLVGKAFLPVKNQKILKVSSTLRNGSYFMFNFGYVFRACSNFSNFTRRVY